MVLLRNYGEWKFNFEMNVLYIAIIFISIDCYRKNCLIYVESHTISLNGFRCFA